MELGGAVYDAISQNCWDDAKNISINSLNQSLALLKVEIYLIKMSKNISSITVNWSQLQPALMAYLKQQNIVLNNEMSLRLKQVISYFGDKKAK